MGKDASSGERRQKYVCPKCEGANHADLNKDVVHDPLYTGPEGHCPEDWCGECWEYARKQLRDEPARRRRYAFYLITEGFTQSQVAEKMGVTDRTIRRWKKTEQDRIVMSDFAPSKSL